MGRLSLAAKITLLIVVVLIIGFGASTIVTIQRESTLLVDLNKRAVRRLTDTLVASIEGAMNQERCQGCHGTDHKVRAVVRVATSMAPVFAEVKRQRNRQIMIGVLTIAAA